MDGTTVGPLHAMPPWHLAMVLHKPILALLGVLVPRCTLVASLADSRCDGCFHSAFNERRAALRAWIEADDGIASTVSRLCDEGTRETRASSMRGT